MSSLTTIERRTLERYLGMGTGYVGSHSDRTFGELFAEAAEVDIHSEEYTANGPSKANKLRTFWQNEPDEVVGPLLDALLDYEAEVRTDPTTEDAELAEKCRRIAARLRAVGPILAGLKAHARTLDAKYLAAQIQRMESSVVSDPMLAIGTAKELIETCCKTILRERNEPIDESMDVPQLTKATLKSLRLLPAEVPDEARGSDIIKRLLSNLSTVGNTKRGHHSFF